MKPKDKANELFTKYYRLFSITLENTISEYEAINCAKICVQEIIKESSNKSITVRYKGCFLTDKQYWQEVLNHLNEM